MNERRWRKHVIYHNYGYQNQRDGKYDYVFRCLHPVKPAKKLRYKNIFKAVHLEGKI